MSVHAHVSRIGSITGRHLLAAIAAVALLTTAGISVAAPLQPRAEVIKPAHTEIDNAQHRSDVISVKFRDGLVVRLRQGSLTGMGTGSLRGAEAVLTAVAGGRWERVHTLPEVQLDALRRTAQNNLGRVVADLNLEYLLFLPEGADASATIDAFNALDAVEIALPVVLPVPAPVAPDFEPNQGYLDAATDGVDAECMWLLPGGTGAGIQVCDIEYSWNFNHQDLPVPTLLGNPPIDPFNDDNHGTAVLGEVAAFNDGVGVTGICHDSTFYVAAANTNIGYNLAGAISTALGTLVAGDVIIIEQQTFGPNWPGGNTQFGLVPSEWVLSVYNTIVTAVGNGIIVAAAAGNGSQNLDDPIYSVGNGGHWPFLAANDSGAIIVGAGAPPGHPNGDRSRLGFSNYGSTVDLQGWGRRVYTTGYGDAYLAEGKNLFYTSTFSGTSSATPIVAGACVLLQSAYEAGTGALLTPAQVKTNLQITGSPQLNGINPASETIGPRPDAAAAICVALPSIDSNSNLIPDPCELDLDIKPGSCPNSFNRGSNGVLPVGLLAKGGFDITLVDLSSVKISRADGVGGSAAPHEGPPGPHSVVADVGTPFDGDDCDCDALGGDGIPDLSLKFVTQEVVVALDLDGLSPGDSVELVVSGEFLSGTPFVASDCVRLVPLGDMNLDGSVNVADLLALLAAWGTDPGGPPDFDGSGNVAIPDMLILLANWTG